MKTQAFLLIVWVLATGFASAGTIADAAAQPWGSEVTINEALILSCVDLVSDPAYRSFQLRDATRAITVYGTNADIEAALTGWSAGDGINITGLTGVADGALRLEPLIGTGGSVGGFAVSGRTSSAPFPFSTTAVVVGPSGIAQSHESDLVCLENVLFDGVGGLGVFTAETNYDLVGGTVVRVSGGDQGVIGLPIPTGRLNITGIVIPDPAGDGYCLALRGPGDIVSVPEPGTLLFLIFGGLVFFRRR